MMINFLVFSGSLNQTPPVAKRPKPNQATPSQQGGLSHPGGMHNGASSVVPGLAPQMPNQQTVIPVEESMALRQEVATLTEDQQQHVVNIMVQNNESLIEDKHGYTEIDLGICRPTTVREIQAYIQSLKAPPPAPLQQQPQPPPQNSSAVLQSLKQVRKPPPQPSKTPAPSPQKAAAASNGRRLSDSSSDSSDDYDSSSGSSSGSDSDSE